MNLVGSEESLRSEQTAESIPNCYDTSRQDPEKYLGTLDEKNVTPLWTATDRMVPPDPNPKAVTTLRDYSSTRPAVMRAVEIVSAE